MDIEYKDIKIRNVSTSELNIVLKNLLDLDKETEQNEVIEYVKPNYGKCYKCGCNLDHENISPRAKLSNPPKYMCMSCYINEKSVK